MKQFNDDRRIFIKQMGILVLGGTAFSSLPKNLLANNFSRFSLPRSTPEMQGISSSDILKFIETAEKRNAGLHSFMIIRHGSIVCEGNWFPYNSELTHWLYSLSKNFTATAIALAIQEGLLKMDDKVISFFPEDKPATIDENLAVMRVRDLLTMSSGHAEDTFRPLLITKDGNWVKTYLSLPVKFVPGTHFVYNSGNTYMLSAIIQKVTGHSMLDYLKPRLFTPLGIGSATWDSDPRGINIGAAGLHLKTEDIAKFGQLYLQKGVWNGKRILTEKWVEEATALQIKNDETGTPTKKEEDDIKQGYGYSFWLSRPVAQGAYRSEGAFCQYSIVMPAQDAIIAINAEGISTHRVMDLCWDILLPAMKAAPLPKDSDGNKALKEKLSSLKLVAPKKISTSPLADSISGKTYKVESNTMNVEAISFSFDKDKTVFKLRDTNGEYKIVCGVEDWITGKTNIPGSPPNFLVGVDMHQSVWKVAASGTWTDEKTFVMMWRFYETPHFDIVTCRFDNDTLSLEFANSITRILKSLKDSRPVLKGIR